MQVNDLFGHIPEKQDFIDIGNQRPSVADEKATLCKRLNEVLRANPKGLSTASVEIVRRWKKNHSEALKTLKSPRASRTDLATLDNNHGAIHT